MENRLIDFHLVHLRGRDNEWLAVLTLLSFFDFNYLDLFFGLRLLLFGFFYNFNTLHLRLFMLNRDLLGLSHLLFSKLCWMIDWKLLSNNFFLDYRFFRKNSISIHTITFLENIVKFLMPHLYLNFLYSTFINLKRWFNLFCNFNGLRKTLLDVDIVDLGASA